MTSPARVARLHLAQWSDSFLTDALRSLDALRELDSNLSALESSFDEHYPGMLRLAALDAAFTTEVTSQGQMLVKAREGLKGAREIKVGVGNVLKQFPDDKTAARIVADAETMVDRFTRHEAAAAKIIRTLAKKQMPDALKKYAAKAEKLISARFLEPEKLQVIPWVSKSQARSSTVNAEGYKPYVDCLQFQVVFRVTLPPPKPESGMDPNDGFYKTPRKVELIAAEDTVGEAGVHISGLGSYTTDDLTKGPDYFVERFLNVLQGWVGLKGEGAANASRLQVANAIAGILEPLARKFGGHDSERARITELSVDVGFRTDIRSEDYGQYDEQWGEEGKNTYEVPARKALAPYMDKIRSFSCGYGEKGWWYYHVALK